MALAKFHDVGLGRSFLINVAKGLLQKGDDSCDVREMDGTVETKAMLNCGVGLVPESGFEVYQSGGLIRVPISVASQFGLHLSDEVSKCLPIAMECIRVGMLGSVSSARASVQGLG